MDLDEFWVDLIGFWWIRAGFGWVLIGFWMNLEWIMGVFWVGFGQILVDIGCEWTGELGIQFDGI